MEFIATSLITPTSHHLTSFNFTLRHTMSHHTASSHVSSHHLTPPHLIHPSPLCTLFPIINDATLPLLHFFSSNSPFNFFHFSSLILPSLLSSFLALPCLGFINLLPSCQRCFHLVVTLHYFTSYLSHCILS